MHNRPRRLAAAGLTGLLLAVALAAPAFAATPHKAPVQKAEPRRVVEYHPNGHFTQDTDLLSSSGYAAWMIDELLRATTPLPPLGAAFTRAERETGINARYLVAHAILETGWGTSWIAQQKHNLFGYNAFDRDPLRLSMRFPSFAAGISFVANAIRTAYLSPDGRWWRGFPTLRGVNRFYASDPFWADKITVLANAIDQVIVTLRERGLHFGRPRITTPTRGGAVAAGSAVFVEVPWTSVQLGLPDAIRFAARWTPVALAEGNPTAPVEPSAPPWALVSRTTREGQTIRLSVTAPTMPGSWRLEIQARDSDGYPLPVTDAPPITSLPVHVAAPTEATISVSLDPALAIREAGREITAGYSTLPVAAPGAVAAMPALQPATGRLDAVIRNIGRTTIPAVALDGTPTLVEAWSLPLEPGDGALRLAGVPLVNDLPPGGQVTVQLPGPMADAVVVMRLAGNAEAIGRSIPVALLVSTSATGPATISALAIPDLRDSGLAQAASETAKVPVARPVEVPVPAVSVLQSDVVGELSIGLVADPTPRALDQPPGPTLRPPWILVRTMSTVPSAPVDSTTTFSAWPGDPTAGGLQVVEIPGMPAGVRLVVVALVGAGASEADAATVRLAWVDVADPGSNPTPR